MRGGRYSRKNRYVDGRNMWGEWNLEKGRLKEGVGDGDYGRGRMVWMENRSGVGRRRV